MPEGVLFKTNESAFTKTKKKLLEKVQPVVHRVAAGWCFFRLRARASKPISSSSHPRQTHGKKIWYYDLSERQGRQKDPRSRSIASSGSSSCCRSRGDSDRSWTVTRAAIEAKNYDLKAVNPNRKVEVDSRTPAEILAAIEQRHLEVAEALKTLRELIGT